MYYLANDFLIFDSHIDVDLFGDSFLLLEPVLILNRFILTAFDKTAGCCSILSAGYLIRFLGDSIDSMFSSSLHLS